MKSESQGEEKAMRFNTNQSDAFSVSNVQDSTMPAKLGLYGEGGGRRW